MWTSGLPGDKQCEVAVDPPSNLNLRRHFVACAVPMIGFGLMDPWRQSVLAASLFACDSDQVTSVVRNHTKYKRESAKDLRKLAKAPRKL